MTTRGLPGENVWLNLQTGAGAGARNVLHQPGGLKFLNTHCCIYELPLLHYLL